MTAIRARVVSWDNDTFPATVDLELDLADGTKALFRDKAPVLGVEPGQAEAWLPCQWVGLTEGMRIELDHGVTSVDGRTQFTVRQDQVTE